MKSIWLTFAGALLLSACGEKDVSVTTVPKSPEEAAVAGDMLRWTLPPDWHEEAGQGMRFATILVGPVGRAYEVVVTRLTGDAGGLLANVNRWRGQLSLPNLDEKDLEKALVRLPSPAGDVLLVDFLGKDPSGRQTRLLAAIMKTRSSSWFFKMTAPKAFIQKSLPQFKSLLRSLRYED